MAGLFVPEVGAFPDGNSALNLVTARLRQHRRQAVVDRKR